MGQAVLATSVLAVLVVGPVALVAYRMTAFLGGSSRSVGLIDLVAALLVFAWLALVAGLVSVTGPIGPSLMPVAVDRALRLLVERSFLGVGPLVGWTYADPNGDLRRIVTPRPVEDIEALLGPGGRFDREPPSVEVGRSVRQTSPTGGRSSTPSTSPVAPKRRTFMGRTTPYQVGRGDTYWSLAERHLGDGKRWAEIRELNHGREVAPGVVLDDDEEDLRRGWTILVPVTGEVHT